MRIETSYGSRWAGADAVVQKAGYEGARATSGVADGATEPAEPVAVSRPRASAVAHADTLLARAIPASERATFRAIERANESVETGGRGPIASRLVTTAGPGSPASFGRSQLLVSLQVDALERMSRTDTGRSRVEAFGVTRDDLLSIDARGVAATRWFDAIVRGQGAGDDSSPLSVDELREAREFVRSGDLDGLVARFGASFEEDTGIAASELADLALTKRVLDRGVQREFRSLRGSMHDDGRALDALVARHPELARVRERIGDDASLSFFLRRPQRNGEHRAAWYTRAARVDAPAYDRLLGALTNGADRLTSRARQIRNYQAARSILGSLSGFAELSEARRTTLLGQLSRVRHGSPSLFAEHFGSARAPRVFSLEDVVRILAQLLSAAVETADGDQGRSVRAFTDRLDVDADPSSSGEVRVAP